MNSAQLSSTDTAHQTARQTARQPTPEELQAISRELNEALNALLMRRVSTSPSPSEGLFSFKAVPPEELTLERLIKNEWISVDITIPTQNTLELMVELQDLSLTHILLWAREHKVPYHFDEHESVYTFELSLPFQEDIDCELSFADGASSRFMLFSAHANSNTSAG